MRTFKNKNLLTRASSFKLILKIKQQVESYFYYFKHSLELLTKPGHGTGSVLSGSKFLRPIEK